MCRFICVSLLLIAAVPMPLFSAPVPKRKTAKPAIIDAGKEASVDDIECRIPILARYAIRDDKKVSKMAIIRKHITHFKPLQKEEWDAFDKWLKKNLRIERVKDKNLVHISFRDGNAEEQAAIINASVDFYLKEEIDSRRKSIVELFKKTGDGGQESLKKQKELLQKLPKLVEHAKAR